LHQSKAYKKISLSLFKQKYFKMKKQGYNARLDESIGGRHKGAHSQSMKSRRDESKAMSKKDYGHSYGADKGMSYRHKHPECVNYVGKHLTGLIKK
tara:strand:- start:102 stop:389 length:288 start_codon:yes stop_codon:yes gene_type:complete